MNTKMKKVVEIELPKLANREKMQKFADAMKAPEFVARVLERLGIEEKEKARNFFVPRRENALSPFKIKGMEEAIPLFKKIKASSEKVVIHGDYDVDGISGTALLYSGLKEAGFQNLEWFLPNRFIEGYGLCKETIEGFKKRGVRWIITVDTGITAVEEIQLAKELGIGVVIMDHHQEGPELPAADLILNPNQKACDYPNKFLCGAGVAYKFLEAFLGADHPGVLKQLDLLVLGTLADMMPVVEENRIYLKVGMEALSRSTRPGVRALLNEAGLQDKTARSQDILYRVTPLINAAGRMGDPTLALRLLLSSNPKEANQMILQMKEANLSRRETEAELYQEAVNQIEENPEQKSNRVLVVHGRDWHQGVIGIVAARLVEKYNKPVGVISIGDDGVGRASARSVEGFNWHKALGECAELLPKWGGHYFAAGFSVDEKDISALGEKLQKVAERIEFVPIQKKRIFPDFELLFKDIVGDSMNWLQRLEPFGPQHEAPLFFARDVYVGQECRIVGGNHLKTCLRQDSMVIDCIGFQLGDWAEKLQASPGPWVIAFNPVWNYFRNQKTIQLQIVGIQSQEEMEERENG